MNREEEWLLYEKYEGERTEEFFADCERLQNGEPLAYVIGSIPFLNTTIALDSHPLIPRPETEYWVEKAIAEISGAGMSEPKILDLCAGSGCIGIAVLAEIPEAHGDFVEIDVAHHATIEKNLHINDIDISRTHILGGDLFENVTSTYDFILSNPPYIDEKKGTAEESVVKHEPHLALYGGENGTELLFKIITDAKSHLNANGVLYLEHEPEQKEALQTFAEEHGYSLVTHNDQYGAPRYSRLCVTQ